MAKAKKQEEEIKTDGWKDTFSDLMNLLLCFFVLLFSMSNVDQVKYAELVASMSNSYSIFSGGAKAIGEGTLISSGSTQLNELDQYITNMGKANESVNEQNPMAEYEKKKKEEQKEKNEELYSEIVEQSEKKHIEDLIEVKTDDNNQYVMISLSGGILFDSGSDEIRKGAKPILSRVSEILKQYPKKMIKIEGHTDNIPISNAKYPSNLWLSTARATKVLEYLVDTRGLNPKNLEASGRGELNPIRDNSTADGRAKNRRVEIKIYSTSN
ncbi:MAG: flagellar motor protein MotB [Lachnospiraceae bacterium]|nr:flagellar motor protein MotB [Lachnospiraceae bacterium]